MIQWRPICIRQKHRGGLGKIVTWHPQASQGLEVAAKKPLSVAWAWTQGFLLSSETSRGLAGRFMHSAVGD